MYVGQVSTQLHATLYDNKDSWETLLYPLCAWAGLASWGIREASWGQGRSSQHHHGGCPVSATVRANAQAT